MPFQWPPWFPRIPDEPWTARDVAELAQKYDTLERHGWYSNLDPTVEELAASMQEGEILVDYSGGTGILIDRLLQAAAGGRFGLINVDASPKFLRVSLEKFREEPSVAFRYIQWLHDEKRLQTLDEVLGDQMVARGIDAIVSTNAIHLYYDLDDTLASWARCLRDDGRVFVQSGNIGRDEPSDDDAWIIDDTVHALAKAAEDVVREEDDFRAYRALLDDGERMHRYDTLRHKYFVPVRPLAHYVEALEQAGLAVQDVTHRRIEADVGEWFEFLAVYHDGILGWIGGSEKVEGTPPPHEAVRDRLAVLRRALPRVFGEHDAFEAEWTYISATKTVGSDGEE